MKFKFSGTSQMFKRPLETQSTFQKFYEWRIEQQNKKITTTT